nr:egl nine homolog 1-like [Vicugna pacos]
MVSNPRDPGGHWQPPDPPVFSRAFLMGLGRGLGPDATRLGTGTPFGGCGPRSGWGGNKSVSARAPPAPAETSLSGGAAQPGPPRPASRNPPGDVHDPAPAEGETRPEGGAAGEAREPGSWVPGLRVPGSLLMIRVFSTLGTGIEA